MHVRTETAADRQAVRAVVVAAFGQPDEADLVDALRDDPAWIPALTVVAVLDDDVVGHATLTRMHVGGAPALALAPVSVVPSAQGRGVGSSLIGELLARARAHAEAMVVVLGDPAYYGRFGFGPASELDVTGPFDGAGDAFQALALGDPALRGPARYADAFGIPD